MMRTVVLAGWLICGVCATARAQGYFDFDSIPGVPDEPTVQVDLNQAIIGFALGAARVSEPEAAEMLEGIEGIRVRVYESLVDVGAVESFLNEASQRLERDGWQRIVFVQEDDDRVRVYARMDGQIMNGMTIMVLDSSEAVFVNIAGRIEPEMLGHIAGGMGFGDILADITGSRSYRGPRSDD
jgi:hypothetical protein